jgi:hypothetical protein
LPLSFDCLFYQYNRNTNERKWPIKNIAISAVMSISTTCTMERRDGKDLFEEIQERRKLAKVCG